MKPLTYLDSWRSVDKSCAWTPCSLQQCLTMLIVKIYSDDKIVFKICFSLKSSFKMFLKVFPLTQQKQDHFWTEIPCLKENCGPEPEAMKPPNWLLRSFTVLRHHCCPKTPHLEISEGGVCAFVRIPLRLLDSSRGDIPGCRLAPYASR